MERRVDSNRERRLEALKAEIAERLRSVCADMSAADFDRIVTHVATLDIKYRLRRDVGVLDSLDAETRLRDTAAVRIGGDAQAGSRRWAQ
jgi:hypothetical protein